MRPLFDSQLSEEEIEILAYLQRRGGGSPESELLHDRRAKHPNILEVLRALEGSWVTHGRTRGEVAWQLLSMAKTQRILSSVGRNPPHHRERRRIEK